MRFDAGWAQVSDAAIARHLSGLEAAFKALIQIKRKLIVPTDNPLQY